MPRNALYLLLVLVITVTILLLYTRYAVTRTPRRFELFSKEEMTPDNEVCALLTLRKERYFYVPIECALPLE